MIEMLVDEAEKGSCSTLTQPRHVLILNWRDIRHPRAGGAEKVTHEIARRWVLWGHSVTLFCAAFSGGATEETVDGVSIVRRGSQHTVHWEAYRYYRRRFRGRYDVIIDEVNTIPFFAPLYADEPVVMFSHQLAREIWRYEAPFPLSAIGYMAEPLYLQAYRRTPVMTVSQSTREELRQLGLTGPYHIIPEAVDVKAPKSMPGIDTKEPALTLAFVGRVVPSKRVDHIVEALGRIKKEGASNARLWIIGFCEEKYRRQLDRSVARAQVQDNVTFFGHVQTDLKEELLARAHVLVMTSVREGWGLVVTEANMLATPAIVYDVPGLRDSTHNGETGLICRHNSPLDLARTILAVYRDPALYARLRAGAWSDAQRLNWDRTARAAWDVVEACW